MHIRFGWTLDGANWTPRATAPSPDASTPHASTPHASTLHVSTRDASSPAPAKHREHAPGEGARADLTLGPRGLIDLLRTRLGLGAPDCTPPIRIAQYRRLMEVADHPWFRASFANDPWNTAGHVLRLRDAAIEAGWTPNAPAADQAPAPAADQAPGPATVPATGVGTTAAPTPRLDALAAVERLVTLGPRGAATTTLTPGPADHLREVIALLQELRSTGIAWPLGITTIRLDEPAADLPGLLPTVLDLLAGAGVRNIEPAAAAEPARGSRPEPRGSGPELSIIAAPTEHSAAEAAARILTGDAAPATVLLGADTMILDQELSRRGLPSIGHAAPSRARLSAQLLPLVLTVIRPQLDVHALAALLSATVTADSEDGPIEASLIPWRARRALLRALEREPGVDRSAADSAWMQALASLDAAVAEDAAAARAVTDLIRTPAEQYGSPGAVRVELLQRKIHAFDALLARRHPHRDIRGALAESRRHTSMLLELLAERGHPTISERELMDLAAASAPAASSPLGARSATPFSVITAPGQLPPGSGHVLWWRAEASDAHRPIHWDPAEAAELERAGARITAPEQVAALRTRAELAALRSADAITIVTMQRRAGEVVAPHPLVAHLVAQDSRGRSDATTGSIDEPSGSDHENADVSKKLTSLTTPASALAAAAIRAGSATTPEPQAPRPPATLTRTLSGGGAHLLPRTLSATQLEMLIGDSLTWVLRYAFGLRASSAATVPTGNQMIGTFAHAVAEHLVAAGSHRLHGPDLADAILSTARSLTPRFASELLLPGAHARCGAVIRTVQTTLAHLLSTLETSRIVIEEMERPISAPLPLTVGTHRITPTLIGSIDLFGHDELGAPVVVDMKWTNSARRYRDLVTDNRALQLVTYLAALRLEGVDRADQAIAGYAMLKHGEVLTADPRLTTDTLDVIDGAEPGGSAELWERVVRTAEMELTRIVEGTITSDAGEVWLASGAPLGNPAYAPPAHRERAALIQAAAREAGGIFWDRSFAYNDYTLITGLSGDFS